MSLSAGQGETVQDKQQPLPRAMHKHRLSQHLLINMRWLGVVEELSIPKYLHQNLTVVNVTC